MDYLHQSSILHRFILTDPIPYFNLRDLKPDNLLMSSLEISSPVSCKLVNCFVLFFLFLNTIKIDFGTTRDINQSQATQYYTKGVTTAFLLNSHCCRLVLLFVSLSLFLILLSLFSDMAPELLDTGKYSQSADVYR